MRETIDQAVSLLNGARRVLCITGAGLSADSGMPTYRGIGGLYDDATTEEGLPIEVAMSGDTLRRAPEITWKYLSQIEQACRQARPNAGHKAIAEMQSLFEVCVLTQNVDGFHRQAGSKNLIEMHGCYDQLYCVACDWERRVKDYSGLTFPPQCEQCGGVVRPKVVLFGEMLPELALEHYHRELGIGFDAILSIGTTSVFPYISGPVALAHKTGTASIEINPGQSEVSHLVDLRIRDSAAAVLPQIVEVLREKPKQ